MVPPARRDACTNPVVNPIFPVKYSLIHRPVEEINTVKKINLPGEFKIRKRHLCSFRINAIGKSWV